MKRLLVTGGAALVASACFSGLALAAVDLGAQSVGAPTVGAAVGTHIKRMLVRLEARTRAHAVAIAFREGLWMSGSFDGGKEVD